MSNDLKSHQGTWIGDGSAGSLATASDSVLSATSNKRGIPFNVLYKPTKALSLESTRYYEIELTKLTGSISMGVVSPDEFLPGWKTRGMFYNGNLTNGSAGLKIGYGASPEDGTTIGVLCVLRGDSGTSVTFYRNGTCLGTGFELAQAAKDFLPCIHVDGNVELKFRFPDTIPSVKSREEAKSEDFYSGDWKIVSAFHGPELHQFPLAGDVILTMKKQDDNSYALLAKVANSMRTQVTLTGKDQEGFDRIEVKRLASTKMMPPPPLVPVEKFVESSLPILFKMIVTEGQLIMTGATAEFTCVPHVKTFSPLDKY